MPDPKQVVRGRCFRHLSVALILLTPLLLLSCGPSSRIDPRCRIQADSPHLLEIARSINGSDLWQEYLDYASPSGASPVVSFSLSMERKSFKSYGGDYDPGKITVVFVAKNLRKSDRVLIKQDPEVALDPFMIGFFPKDATREQMNEVVFKAMEEKIYPYMDRWVNLAVIRAMGQEGSTGSRFIPTLEDLVNEAWTSGDMKAAARQALQSILG